MTKCRIPRELSQQDVAAFGHAVRAAIKATFAARCEDIRAVCHSCAHLDPLEALGIGERASWWHGMSRCVAGPIYARLLADGHTLADVVARVRESQP